MSLDIWVGPWYLGQCLALVNINLKFYQYCIKVVNYNKKNEIMSS